MDGGRYHKVTEDSEVFSEALKVYEMGHNDMIDNILYADSLLQDLKLLTLDHKLNDFIQAHRLTNTLMFPDQLHPRSQG